MKRQLLLTFVMMIMLCCGRTVKGETVWIHDVYTDPIEPTNIDVVTIIASGEASSGGVLIDDSIFQMEGTSLNLDIFFTLGPFGVITPWSHSEIIGTLPANFYNLTTRAYDYDEITETYLLTDTYSTSFTVTPEPSTTYFVDAVNGNDGNDGLSPETAFATIQKGIDSADDYDVVLVADGTYTGPGNRDIDFLGKAITVRSESGPESCIIDCNGTETEPHRGFKFHSGEDANSIVQGFTIIHGVARYGGAIFCEFNSSPTITNCIISGNLAVGHSGESSFGGGIYCNYKSNPTITNCTISNNSACYGGGIICRWYSNAVISNCTISNNSARYLGGGISCLKSSPTITNCIINNNLTRYGRWGGGGGISCGGASPIITGCTISDNMSSAEGGGIYCEESNPTIRGCTITHNSAEREGGGISYMHFDSPTIINCVITHNTADRGGGLCGYEGLITNCIISGNMADKDGGGICRSGHGHRNLEVTNCTITGNSAAYEGGGIYFENQGSSIIANCIIWENSPQQITGISSVTYSDVQGSWPGEGNIDTNPLFMNASNGDLRLLPASPCIDAGDNTAVPPDTTDLDGDGDTSEPIPLDLAGNPRFVDQPEVPDTGNGIPPIVDMGAFEANYIEVAMKFTPKALNLRSKGKWVKAHFVLPEGFLPEEVDADTPAVIEPLGIESDHMNVFINEDGLVEIKAAFSRSDFCASAISDDATEVMVVGQFISGQYFYGTDTIKIINKSLESLAAFASHWLDADCSMPDWCAGLDVNQDSVINFIDFAMSDTCCFEVIKK